jgi:LPPG:FO 2-phospho-L-lactate transferase
MLAAGIRSQFPDDRLTVIANIADDDEFWGLTVCPDIDSVVYRLAGVFNESAGYGVKGDTFAVLDALARVGGESWFRIGDRDFATHLLRAELLRKGLNLTQASLELCRRLGLAARVLPVTDDRVRTRFATDQGELSFQEYFVREHLAPRLTGISFRGIETARPTAEVLDALASADRVLIGPSNPLISVAPILRIAGAHVPRERTAAVSPIVGGIALKGPTVQMMTAMGHPATPREVAKMYVNVASRFVLDVHDAEQAGEIREKLGYEVLVCDTVMRDGGAGLAAAILGSV